MMSIHKKHYVLFICLALIVPNFYVAHSAAKDTSESRRSVKAIQEWVPKLDTQLADNGFELGAPIFLRLTKTTSKNDTTGYLEAFVKTESGEFKFFKRWEICTYSGALGPKLREGDGQSPEGFYFVKPSSMNPQSSYHLSFNLGFPNLYDRAHGRTGSFLMVHGDCVSIGCYAMTDRAIEEIYTLMDAAFKGGQPFIRTHIFPFPMTAENMQNFIDNPNYEFWENLKDGWDMFEETSRPPNVDVENKVYIFN
jgi:murein L,D-transpeptidase YafK